MSAPVPSTRNSTRPPPEWDLLLSAAQKNQSDRIQLMISQQGVDPNHANSVGQSALHIAALWGHVDAVQALLLAGAQPNVRNQLGGGTPLHMLIQSRKSTPEATLQVAELLLQYGADSSVTDNRGHAPVDYLERETVANNATLQRLYERLAPRPSALFEAIENNDFEMVSEVITANKSTDTDTTARVNENSRGQSPLSLAIDRLLNQAENVTGDVDSKDSMEKRVKIIQTLLDNGADPFFTTYDEFGQKKESMLHNLLEALRHDELHRQRQKIASVERGDANQLQRTVLQQGLEDIICLFLKAGAGKSHDLEHFLHLAARFNQVSFAQFLIQRAAPILTQQEGKDGVSASLIVNSRGRQGLTALHFCARSGQMEMLRFLLSLPDIDVHVKDDRGMTALDAARVNDKADVVEVLQDHCLRTNNLTD